MNRDEINVYIGAILVFTWNSESEPGTGSVILLVYKLWWFLETFYI